MKIALYHALRVLIVASVLYLAVVMFVVNYDALYHPVEEGHVEYSVMLLVTIFMTLAIVSLIFLLRLVNRKLRLPSPRREDQRMALRQEFLYGDTPAQQQKIREEMRRLYPKPTDLFPHPLIALTEGGERLMVALRDGEIQRIEWERHHFLSAAPGGQNDPHGNDLPSNPATIEMPDPDGGRFRS
ncbi:MAG: hypothetical protein QOG89_261 [Thermomicrobiales bacterium]|nr:hypothetical protein [Thermomicrobiales bacterium]